MYTKPTRTHLDLSTTIGPWVQPGKHLLISRSSLPSATRSLNESPRMSYKKRIHTGRSFTGTPYITLAKNFQHYISSKQAFYVIDDHMICFKLRSNLWTATIFEVAHAQNCRTFWQHENIKNKLIAHAALIFVQMDRHNYEMYFGVCTFIFWLFESLRPLSTLLVYISPLGVDSHASCTTSSSSLGIYLSACCYLPSCLHLVRLLLHVKNLPMSATSRWLYPN